MVQPTHHQIETCRRFGSPVEPPDPMLKVGIALETLATPPLNALRHAPEGDTCGWYIWGGELSGDPGFFQALHVSHLPDACPLIVPYLALAPGWRVLLAPSQEDVWYDGSLLDVESV